jgi:hypothetical protein
MKYTKEYFIKYLTDFYNYNNEIPKSKDKRHPFSCKTVTKYFGSWNKALIESKIPLIRNIPVILLCSYCDKKFKIQYCHLKDSLKHFCSRNCSASYNNKNRIITKAHKQKTSHTLKNKQYNKTCITCDKIFITNFSRSKYCSDNCKKKYTCVICNINFYNKQIRKTCSDICLRKLRRLNGVKGGLKSQLVRPLRSKGEILFYELCVNYFGYNNVLSNKQMFRDKNGNYWDVDIIIPKYKICVSYNGIYHYEKISEKHNLNQVQTRDKIKSQIITDNKYTEYIVKDLGKFNKDFVYNEFHKFIFKKFIIPEFLSF